MWVRSNRNLTDYPDPEIPAAAKAEASTVPRLPQRIGVRQAVLTLCGNSTMENVRIVPKSPARVGYGVYVAPRDATAKTTSDHELTRVRISVIEKPLSHSTNYGSGDALNRLSA